MLKEAKRIPEEILGKVSIAVSFTLLLVLIAIYSPARTMLVLGPAPVMFGTKLFACKSAMFIQSCVLYCV